MRSLPSEDCLGGVQSGSEGSRVRSLLSVSMRGERRKVAGTGRCVSDARERLRRALDVGWRLAVEDVGSRVRSSLRDVGEGCAVA